MGRRRTHAYDRGQCKDTAGGRNTDAAVAGQAANSRKLCAVSDGVSSIEGQVNRGATLTKGGRSDGSVEFLAHTGRNRTLIRETLIAYADGGWACKLCAELHWHDLKQQRPRGARFGSMTTPDARDDRNHRCNQDSSIHLCRPHLVLRPRVCAIAPTAN